MHKYTSTNAICMQYIVQNDVVLLHADTFCEHFLIVYEFNTFLSIHNYVLYFDRKVQVKC